MALGEALNKEGEKTRDDDCAAARMMRAKRRRCLIDILQARYRDEAVLQLGAQQQSPRPAVTVAMPASLAPECCAPGQQERKTGALSGDVLIGPRQYSSATETQRYVLPVLDSL